MKIRCGLALMSVLVASTQTLVMAHDSEAQAISSQQASLNQLLDVKSKLAVGIKKTLLAPEMQGTKLVTLDPKSGEVKERSFETLLSGKPLREFAIVTPVIPEINRAFGVKTTVTSVQGTSQISYCIRVKSADFRMDYAGRVFSIDLKDINQTQAIVEDNVRSLSAQVAKRAGIKMNAKKSKSFAQSWLNQLIPSAEAAPTHDNLFTKIMMGVVFLGGVVVFYLGVLAIIMNKGWIDDIKYTLRKGAGFAERRDEFAFIGGGTVVMVLAAYGMYSGLKSIFEF